MSSSTSAVPHWDLELGAITEINNLQRGSCLLFDDITDYPSGYRVVTGTTGSPGRMAASLGFPCSVNNAELVQALRGKPHEWESLASQFPPQYVDSGPLLENVKSGDQVNLWEFSCSQVARKGRRTLHRELEAWW